MHRLSFVMSGLVVCVILGLVPPGEAQAAKASKKGKRASPVLSQALSAAKRYAEAVASGNRVEAGRLDFACQFGLVSAGRAPLKTFPPESDPVYARCWEKLAKAHETAVEQRNLSVSDLWPGKGSLVFFKEDLTEYAPSFFVMDRLGLSPPGSGLKIEPVGSAPIPRASFRLRADSPVVEAPTTAVRLAVTYKDSLTSPVTYAPSEDYITRKAKKVRLVLKGVTVKMVVLTGLRRLGFPGDAAVLNLPLLDAAGGAVPFVSERGGYLRDTRRWWGAADAPGVLIAAVGRAALFPEQHDRVAMLNRVLLIDPNQTEALTLLANEMYTALLNLGAAAHKQPLGDAALAARYNELYWNTVAQTYRMEIAEPSFVVQRGQPMPADYLYRMLPAREKLARLAPEDLESRLRLGIGYRWNRDHEDAIAVHARLLDEIPPARVAARTRVLLEVAWSRIAKLEWSRRLEDPDIGIAYAEAEEALKLTENPLDKFMAAYTMAYSRAFMPQRDNQKMLELLTEAHTWYLKVPGATPASWHYLLQNDTLKGVVEADPAFQPLLTAS